jgi:glycosyltransferase involved in cell wall biosynthesis
MKKIKILFILHLPPPVHGSSTVGQYIYESKIINNAFECRFINLSTSRLINEIGKKPIQKIGRYFSILCQVFKQLICFKPQLCYLAITAKGYAFYKDALIALMAKAFKVPLVYHFHNKGVSTRQHKAIDNFLYRRVFKNAHAILLSKYLYPDVEKYFTPERVHFCPNGIPDINFRQKTLDKKQNKKTEILFLSNLIESKGVFVLLEACVILKQKGLAFHCTYVGGEGDVNAKQFQEKVKELGLTDQVVYAGKKYGEDKEEAFAKADIFAFPSYNETFGLVNLEAMQFSLPIVSTFEGGIPEVIEEGKTGYLVPQKDVEKLAEKLEILIKNPDLRHRMGIAGRIKYENQFTLSVFENRLKDILTTIIQRKDE